MKKETSSTIKEVFMKIGAILSYGAFASGIVLLFFPTVSETLVKFHDLSDREALHVVLLILEMKALAISVMLMGIFLRISTLEFRAEIKLEVPDDSASKNAVKKPVDRDERQPPGVAQARSAWTENEKDE